MAPFEEFEAAFSDFVGAGDTVSTNTGTAALHLAIEGRHYPPGAEVITPEFSMIATAYAPYYARCKPVFVDCRDDMLIDPALLEEKINERTAAVIITHIYGRVCEVEPILAICRKHGIDLIEDCCEIHGARYKDGPRAGERVGSLGIGCFSFYRNKIVHAEEGGAVCVSGDPAYAADLRDLKNMSFGARHDYVHQRIGFNYRMPDSQAVLALASLKEVESSLRHRKQVEAWYDHYLEPRFHRPAREVVWVYDIDCGKPGELVAHLNALGIAARRTFAPMSMQPCFGPLPGYRALKACTLYESTCYLPVSDDIDEAAVKRISEIVNRLG